MGIFKRAKKASKDGGLESSQENPTVEGEGTVPVVEGEGTVTDAGPEKDGDREDGGLESSQENPTVEGEGTVTNASPAKDGDQSDQDMKARVPNMEDPWVYTPPCLCEDSPASVLRRLEQLETLCQLCGQRFGAGGYFHRCAARRCDLRTCPSCAARRARRGGGGGGEPAGGPTPTGGAPGGAGDEDAASSSAAAAAAPPDEEEEAGTPRLRRDMRPSARKQPADEFDALFEKYDAMEQEGLRKAREEKQLRKEQRESRRAARSAREELPELLAAAAEHPYWAPLPAAAAAAAAATAAEGGKEGVASLPVAPTSPTGQSRHLPTLLREHAMSNGRLYLEDLDLVLRRPQREDPAYHWAPRGYRRSAAVAAFGGGFTVKQPTGGPSAVADAAPDEESAPASAPGRAIDCSASEVGWYGYYSDEDGGGGGGGGGGGSAAGGEGGGAGAEGPRPLDRTKSGRGKKEFYVQVEQVIKFIEMKNAKKYFGQVLEQMEMEKKQQQEEYEQICEKALFVLTKENPLRKVCMRIEPHPWFNNFITLVIVLNSVFLAMVDYGNVDENGDPSADGSWRNGILEESEIYFTVIFLAECVVKVVAMGFRPYIRISWNQLDFVVVLSSLLSLSPSVPNVSVLRTFRVLRPLKSLSKLPGLKRIIEAMQNSATDLAQVVFLLFFMLAIYAILGVQFYSGLLSYRCRTTPYPVTLWDNCTSVDDACWDAYLNATASDPAAYRCLNVSNNNFDEWGKAGSPWKEPQDCVWPVVEQEIPRMCDSGNGGYYSCPSGQTCGSNYDEAGNARFLDSSVPYGYGRMSEGLMEDNLGRGKFTFDNFADAFSVVFQMVTLESWTNVVYMCSDAAHPAVAGTAFSLLVLKGAFVLVNLVLGVMTKYIAEAEAKDRALKEAKMTKQELLRQGAGVDPAETAWQQRLEQFPRWRQRLVKVLYGGPWNTIMTLFIVLNTATLSMDTYPENDDIVYVLNYINLGLTIIFVIEMVVSLVGFGLKEYSRHVFNLFDGFIVMTSLVELAVSYFSGGSGGGGLSAFRTLRLFRVFKLAKNWKDLQMLLTNMIKTTMQVGNFALLVVLFVYIFALIGMQFFANLDMSTAGSDAESVTRLNFDTLLWSCVTVFAVMTLENWNTVMNSMWAAGGPGAAFYFFMVVIIGAFIVMNIFLAILLYNFSGMDESLKGDGPGAFKRFGTGALNLVRSRSARFTSSLRSAPSFRDKHPGLSQKLGRALRRARGAARAVVEHRVFKGVILFAILFTTALLALETPLSDPDSTQMKMLGYTNDAFDALFLTEVSLKIFAYGAVRGPEGFFKEPWNWLDFFIVAISYLQYAGIDADTLRALRALRVLRPLRVLNRFEALRKVVAVMCRSVPTMGKTLLVCLLFFLIFAIVGTNYLKGALNMCYGTDGLSGAQYDLLTYPVKWAKLNATEQGWFDGTDCSTEDTYPSSPTSEDLCECWEDLYGTYWDAVAPQSFDNVYEAMCTLFEISTTEGWVDVMLYAVDNRGIGYQPVKNANTGWVFFFIIFMLVGSFFVMNIFVGVIVDFFSRESSKSHEGQDEALDGGGGGGTLLMTEKQREWARTQKLLIRARRGARKLFNLPRNRLRRAMARLTMSRYFEGLTMFVIIFNAAVLASTSFGQSDAYTYAQLWMNYTFAMYFTFELLVKVVALGPGNYLRDSWNKFDLLVVFFTNLGIALDNLTNIEVGGIASVVRILRVCRVFRMFDFLEGLNKIVMALVSSAPSFCNVGAVLFLVFYMYAVCGVQLFALVEYNSDVYALANFRNLGNALFSLFRFSTGENWNGYMHSLMEDADDCDDDLDYDPDWCITEDQVDCVEINGCGAGEVARIYFFTFILIVLFSMVNLFIGIIIESADMQDDEEAHGSLIEEEDLTSFQEAWLSLDQSNRMILPKSYMRDLLTLTKPPLGFDEQQKRMGPLVKDLMVEDLNFETTRGGFRCCGRQWFAKKGGEPLVTFGAALTAVSNAYLRRMEAEYEHDQGLAPPPRPKAGGQEDEEVKDELLEGKEGEGGAEARRGLERQDTENYASKGPAARASGAAGSGGTDADTVVDCHPAAARSDGGREAEIAQAVEDVFFDEDELESDLAMLQTREEWKQAAKEYD